MAEDEEQLEFDFTEYDDGAEKEAHETREALNFSAVQAIEEAPEILERFEKLSLLNAFQVNGKIAKCEGQSSFVFCATDCATDKKVVLKCLDPLFTGGNEGLPDIDPDIDYEKLFEWEDKILELLKQNRHSVNKIKKLSRAPVKIKSGGEIFLHKVSYFAAENLGVELKKAFLDKKNSSFSKKSNLLRLFCQILTAVYSIHRAGVFHRDLKPSNLMARSGKKSDGVVLIDFASSSVKVELINKIMMFPQKWHGTADYAAPEISCGLGPEGELAAAQDMYSLGCMLYELFSYDTFAQRLSALNPRYIETMENCRIYSNDGETLEERLEAYGLYLDSFALSVRPVRLGEEVCLPRFVKDELNGVIQKLTEFDWRKRPETKDIPEIRKRLYSLSKILSDAHLLKIAKERKLVHRKRLLERKRTGLFPEAK